MSTGENLLPVYETTQLSEALKHFEEFGHCAIADVFEEDQATDMLKATQGLRSHSGVVGEQRIVVDYARLQKRDSWVGAQQRMTQVAAYLGYNNWPFVEGRSPIIQFIFMEPNTKGREHYDIETGLFGIANASGQSFLNFAEGRYLLNPGTMAFHDAERKLNHWGETEDSSRSGFAVFTRS